MNMLFSIILYALGEISEGFLDHKNAKEAKP